MITMPSAKSSIGLINFLRFYPLKILAWRKITPSFWWGRLQYALSSLHYHVLQSLLSIWTSCVPWKLFDSPFSWTSCVNAVFNDHSTQSLSKTSDFSISLLAYQQSQLLTLEIFYSVSENLPIAWCFECCLIKLSECLQLGFLVLLFSSFKLPAFFT